MKQSLSCLIYLSSLLFPLVTSTAAQVLVTPPANPLDSASKPVANNFVSLSIAIHFFQDYSRTGTEGELPNTFSRNLLSSLQESTFLAPEIRIGGTSADRTTYVPSQNTTISQVSGANGIPLNVTLNQKWFQQCFDEENFPSGTKFIFDLPLMRNDSLALNNTIQGSKWALEAIGEKRLEAFEIGNEEDLYVGQGVVPANWTVVDYVARWKVFSSAVYESALVPSGLDSNKKWFQGLAFSGLGANPAWTTQTAFNANVNENSTLKSVSLHNYPAGTAPWVNLGNTFMNHTAIVANLSQVKDDIAFLGSSPSTDDIVFNLGETNIDFTNLNMDQFEGVLGSALWTIDYILYAASLNINRIYLHQGTTFGYAAWQPIATTSSPAKVRTPWYGLKFAAEAIGSHQGPIQIAPLDILLTSEKISAYAVYESSSLARIALINFNEWNGTTPYPRPSAVFRIVLPPSNSANTGKSNSVSTRLLTAPNGASADSELTFGGIMWNYTTQGLPQRVESVPGTVEVKRSPGDGSITVKVGASEALLIDING
ncbi:glycoside hydrolase family 79 protein [Lentinula aff. lateritia]|uniref:Glycoside hydrolase family 79 protein n=1 Tax=Lentinula aff. lateritia TaxID=2804960 RepID=A0ACC1U2I1_9AGAR|nr:glycoside hydrolase family 79 protein [Lentinula aff. lateritia]